MALFQHIPGLYVAPSSLKGRGVFCSIDIAAEALIEICPAIVIPALETKVIHKTTLHDYYFLWGAQQKSSAIALGYGSLYNHAYKANAKYLIDEANETIDIIAIRAITAGEEITINYNGDPNNMDPVWFDK